MAGSAPSRLWGDATALDNAMATQLENPSDRLAKIERAKEYLPEMAAARYWKLGDRKEAVRG